MKKSTLTSFIFALLAISCSSNKDEAVFNPAEASVVSDLSDQVAHCAVFVTDSKDNVYIAYYRDPQQTLEAAYKLSTYPVLLKTSMDNLSKIERQDIIKANQTIGDFQQGERAPYDPNLLLLDKELFCYFNGFVDGQVAYCARKYDTKKDEFEDNAHRCTLSYDGPGGKVSVPFDARHMFEYFDNIGLANSYHNDVVMSARFVKYKGEYYNVATNAFTKRSYPLVVKTKDGINFDVVFACKEFPFGSAEAVLEIVDDNFFVSSRVTSAPKGTGGTYLAKFNSKGECLVAPKYLAFEESKIALLNYKGDNYIIYNAYPNVILDDGRVPTRSRLRFSCFDDECNILDSRDVTNPYGVHYPYVDIVKGKPWMLFTEDRKMLDLRQCRTNVSFTELNL